MGLPAIYDVPEVIEPIRRTGEGGVYVIKGAEGLHKIGSAANIPHRLRVLQTGSATPLEHVLTIPTKQHTHHALEQQLHRRLAAKRVRGEWFSLDDTDIIALRAVAGAA